MLTRKRLCESELDALPLLFEIPGLASLVVGFLPTAQWGEWVWQATQHPQAFVSAAQMLAWRKSVSLQALVNLFRADDFIHLKLIAPLPGHYLQDQFPKWQSQTGWITDLLSCSKDTFELLLPLVSTFEITEALHLASTQTTEDWRLSSLLQKAFPESIMNAFKMACLSNHVVNAKKILASGFVTNYKCAFQVIPMDSSIELLEFLFGLGCDANCIISLRRRFIEQPILISRVRSTGSFEFWFRYNVFLKCDTKRLFEMAFETNNAMCVEYFRTFAWSWPSPPLLKVQNIKNMICLEVALYYLCTDVMTTLSMIPNLAQSQEQAQKLVSHAIERACSGDDGERKSSRRRSIVKRAARYAWENKNVQMLTWLWNTFPYFQQYAFEKRFRHFRYCTTTEMTRFLLMRQPRCLTRTLKYQQQHFFIQQAAKDNNADMFMLLCAHDYVSDQDLLREDSIGSLLMQLCWSKIGFLQSLWTPHSVVFRKLCLSLLAHAFLHDKIDVVAFLLDRCRECTIFVPTTLLATNIPILCRLNRVDELRQIQKQDLTQQDRDTCLQEAYTSIHKNAEVAVIAEIIWNLCPLTSKELLNENCQLFDTLALQNIDLLTWIWRKNIVTPQELFCEAQKKNFSPTAFDRFAHAIDFDIDFT